MKRLTYVLLAVTLVALAALPAAAQDWINVRLNADITQQLQNEQQVVVNPTNPLNLVAIWRDFRLGYRQVAWGYTFDGGRTWTNPGLFVDPHYANDSDPALTVNAEGDFFAMLLAYTGDTGQTNGMLMYRSTNGGVTWEERGFAINQVPGVFEDKEFIACDRTGSAYHGRIYMVWDRFYETNIYSVHTADEGATWSSARRVSDLSSNQFPTPAVGANGEYYVAWTNFSGSIRFDKSLNGGVNFGSDITVTSLVNPYPTLDGGIEAPAHPAMDVDISGGLYNGRIYIAYINIGSGSNDYDLYVRHSDNQGASWSSARRINDDTFDNGRDQFHPWLTVDNTGVVHAVWLDRRQDPANLKWHCYVSQSFDGGMTWAPNQQVSTVASDPADTGPEGAEPIDYAADAAAKIAGGPKVPGWVRAKQAPPADRDPSGPRPDQDPTRAGTIGEYIGVAGWDGYSTLVWTDTRAGHQDTYGGVRDETIAVDEPVVAADDLLRVWPNPASGPLTLSYDVPEDGRVTLEIYDVSGRRVRTLVDRKLRSGRQTFVWDGTNQVGDPVAPGSYWLRYRAADSQTTRTILWNP